MESSEILYGSEGLTIQELRDEYFIDITEEDKMTPQLISANVRLIELYQKASFEAAESSDRYLVAKQLLKEKYDAVMDEEVTKNAKLKVKEQLTATQLRSRVENQLRSLVSEVDAREAELAQWNRILESLRFVGKRVDNCGMMAAVEAKALNHTT